LQSSAAASVDANAIAASNCADLFHHAIGVVVVVW
jgi:hypothetical protein